MATKRTYGLSCEIGWWHWTRNGHYKFLISSWRKIQLWPHRCQRQGEVILTWEREFYFGKFTFSYYWRALTLQNAYSLDYVSSVTVCTPITIVVLNRQNIERFQRLEFHCVHVPSQLPWIYAHAPFLNTRCLPGILWLTVLLQAPCIYDLSAQALSFTVVTKQTIWKQLLCLYIA